MKKKQIVDSPDELKLKHLEEAIAVIGIFESKGKYFPEFGKKGNLSVPAPYTMIPQLKFEFPFLLISSLLFKNDATKAYGKLMANIGYGRFTLLASLIF